MMETGTRERDRDLDRLVEIELTEIPRIRAALSDWVDDALLSAKLRALRREADLLRTLLDLDR